MAITILAMVALALPSTASAWAGQTCVGGSTGSYYTYGSVTTCTPLPAGTIATTASLYGYSEHSGSYVFIASTFSACAGCGYDAAFAANPSPGGSMYTAGTHFVCMPPPFSPSCKTAFSVWFFST
ncbi:MAG: hypothetical protein R3B97_04860 [Dehalococcoidia bacterium]|nr:hypothetical protein [Dehalococcoidia bacterium]MCB9486515.1 hypothetical protein [Thermoflexaceae bacterium]